MSAGTQEQVVGKVTLALQPYLDPSLAAHARLRPALASLASLDGGDELPTGAVQPYGALTEVAMSHRKEGEEVMREACAVYLECEAESYTSETAIFLHKQAADLRNLKLPGA